MEQPLLLATQIPVRPIDRYHALLISDSVDYYLDDPGPVPSLDVIIETTDEEDCSALPFPQADDVRRVIDVVDAVAAGTVTRAAIAARFDFDERQADYYANAAAYLSLIKKGQTGFEATAVGREFVSLSFTARQTLILRQIVRRPVFRKAIVMLCDTGKFPPRELVAEWISIATGLSGKTPLRRAGTVLSWVKWAQQSTKPAQLEISWSQ